MLKIKCKQWSWKFNLFMRKKNKREGVLKIKCQTILLELVYDKEAMKTNKQTKIASDKYSAPNDSFQRHQKQWVTLQTWEREPQGTSGVCIHKEKMLLLIFDMLLILLLSHCRISRSRLCCSSDPDDIYDSLYLVFSNGWGKKKVCGLARKANRRLLPRRGNEPWAHIH